MKRTLTFCFCLSLCVVWALAMSGTRMSAQSPGSQARQKTKERRQVIRHRGFEDFIKGSFEDGGASIYVSKNGAIQLIPRWDLNNDGELDLLMTQDHNPVENVDAFIYWGTPEGYHSLYPAFWKELPGFKFIEAVEENRRSMTFLPTFGGGPVKIVDLDRDGYPDIVFPNTIHNYYVDMQAYIYWGGPQGYSLRRRTELPTLFAQDLAVADFNQDGYPDLVFANFGNESGDRWGYKNNLESYIYWGAPDGYSLQRRTSIPTVSAVSCVAGDFNGDGWPDLAFVNNNLRHRSVTVYLGGKEGFSPQRRLEIEGGNPGIVRAGDLNKDGFDDLIVGSREKGVTIYSGSSNFSLSGGVELPAENVKDAVVADLNHDGHMDLVLASQSVSQKKATTESIIYWGAATGFDPQRRQLLPTLWPAAVASSDLNGDGYPDIIFANSHDGETFDVPSYIYWGAPGGFDASRKSDLQGFGPVGVAAADLNRDGKPEVVLMNQISGRVQDTMPSVIFWGNPAHEYSEANATLLPTRGPYYTRVADLNDDGFPDIVFTGSPCYVYWGSANGFAKRTEINIAALGITVGDFNHDGSLDLAFSIWSGDPRVDNYGVVVWGGANGYSLENSTKIPLRTATRAGGGVASADLNKDGYLDLIFPAGESPSKSSEIVWGGPKGFGSVPSTVLHTDMVDTPAVADLDGNGWLDLIFPGSKVLDTQDPHAKSLVYWGSKQGYSDQHRTELEAYESCEIEVADLNRDGYLDLVAGNYKAEHTRHVPAFIYWGNPAHEYGNQHRTDLPAESSCGIQILDLNQDGYPDIIVHNHIKDGDHTFGGYIYWGGKDGYSSERRTHLPTMGTHYANGITPGNIYDRRPEYDFISPPASIARGARQLTLDWQGETPHQTAIRFEVRAAAQETELSSAAWAPITRGTVWPLPAGSNCVQYRAILVSPDGANSPILREVTLELE